MTARRESILYKCAIHLGFISESTSKNAFSHRYMTIRVVQMLRKQSLIVTTARSSMRHHETAISDGETMPSNVFNLLLRRIVAFLYDSLLLIAVFMGVTALAIAFNEGRAIEHHGYKIVMWVIAVLFFTGFWKRGGQTLGMQAWRIKVEAIDGQPPSTQALLIRAITGSLLFVFTWLVMLFDKDGLAMHDKLSKTRIVRKQ